MSPRGYRLSWGPDTKWAIAVLNEAGDFPVMERDGFLTCLDAFAEASRYLSWIDALAAQEAAA